jgi:hypothetical protein
MKEVDQEEIRKKVQASINAFIKKEVDHEKIRENV